MTRTHPNTLTLSHIGPLKKGGPWPILRLGPYFKNKAVKLSASEDGRFCRAKKLPQKVQDTRGGAEQAYAYSLMAWVSAGLF